MSKRIRALAGAVLCRYGRHDLSWFAGMWCYNGDVLYGRRCARCKWQHGKVVTVNRYLYRAL